MNPMDQKQQYKFPGYTKPKRAKIRTTDEDTSKCPYCGADTVTDNDKAEIYCHDCGLVVKASIEYVGNKRLMYPYGILL